MPRKFQDSQTVKVHYASRRMHFNFFGIVEKYRGGKYYVRYLAGEKAGQGDMVFICNVHELFIPSSEDITGSLESQMDRYNRMLHARFTGRAYHYGSSQGLLLWLSFAAKRVQDKAWHRTFPISNTYGRHDRVYN